MKKLSKTKILKSKKALHARVWKIFSIWVRKTAANFQGLAPCYSCGLLFDWKSLHAGHFRHDCYDFDPLNIHPQCSRCNTFLHGNLGNYAVHLIQEYGINRVEAFQDLPKWNDYSMEELENLEIKYAVLLQT
jgi:hypothetical protein